MKNTKTIKLSSDVKVIRRARELSKVSRNQLGQLLGISNKAIEKIENGRMRLSASRITEILEALNLKQSDLIRIKKGKDLLKPKRKLIVTSNNLRRSYKKLITKECRVLKSMRKQKGFSQDHASHLCGYSRPSIGHIENGRIELSKERIIHILKSYGYKYQEFESNFEKKELRDQVIDSCFEKINKLDDTMLDIVKNLLGSL
jgi:transcriptional regulator with XRE-family HTH domain